MWKGYVGIGILGVYEWVGGWVLRWMRVRAGVVGMEMGEGNDVIVACLGLGWDWYVALVDG
jgi:hypothetical protein